jgi:hypothetical protein
MFSCTKQEEQVINFFLNVSAFSTQVATFKGLQDDPFSAFAHLYPTNSNITFTSSDGKKYLFYTGNFTIETFKFGLPVGTYTMTGSGIGSGYIEGGQTQGSKDMSFTIPIQTITITLNTVSIPITINPTCFLILVADPNLLIDETNKPRIANYNSQYSGGTSIYPLILINPNLRYIYAIPWEYANFMILKKDKSELVCDPTSACFKNGFIYKILINTATTPSIINPTFQQTDLLNF